MNHEQLSAAAILVIKPLAYSIFKTLLAESVLTAKEIAITTNYSVREIQSALNALIKQDLVLRTKIKHAKAPVYHLNRGKIQTANTPAHQ